MLCFDTLAEEDLLSKIEELRMTMHHHYFQTKNLNTKEMLLISQELDNVMNHYNRLNVQLRDQFN